MADDCHPVRGAVHVRLEVGDADGEGREKREKGVFRRTRRQSSMREDARQRAREEPAAVSDCAQC